MVPQRLTGHPALPMLVGVVLVFAWAVTDYVRAQEDTATFEVVAPEIVPQGEDFTAMVVESTPKGDIPLGPGDEVAIQGMVVPVEPGGKVKVPAFATELGNQFLVAEISRLTTGSVAISPHTKVNQHVEVVPAAPSELPTKIARAPEMSLPGQPFRVEGQALDKLTSAALIGSDGTAHALTNSVGSSLQRVYIPPADLPHGKYTFSASDAAGNRLTSPSPSVSPTVTVRGETVQRRGQHGVLTVTSDAETDVMLLGGEPEITLEKRQVHVSPQQPAQIGFTAKKVGSYSIHTRILSREEPSALAPAPSVNSKVGPALVRYNPGRNETDVTASISVTEDSGRPLANAPVDVSFVHPGGIDYQRVDTDKNGRATFVRRLPGNIAAASLAVNTFRVPGRLWDKAPPHNGNKPGETPPPPKTQENPTPVTPGETPPPPKTPPPHTPEIPKIPTTTEKMSKCCGIDYQILPGPGIQLSIVSPNDATTSSVTNEPVPLIVTASDIDQLLQTCACIKDGGLVCTSQSSFNIVDTVSYKWTLSSGKGKLLGNIGPSTLYQPPDLKISDVDKVEISVEVRDFRGDDKPASATFTLTITRKSMNDYERVSSSTKQVDAGSTATTPPQACACAPQPPKWNPQPALTAGTKDGEIKICAGSRVILDFDSEDDDTLILACDGDCGRVERQPKLVDESVYTWIARRGGFPDHGGSAVTNSRHTTAIYKAPDTGGEDTVTVTIADSGMEGPDPPITREIKLKVYKLEIVDQKTGAVISDSASPLPATVAVRKRLKARLTPADPGASYKWEVGGDRIKTYEHRIDDPAKHKSIDLTAADLSASDVSFFFTKEGNNIPIQVSVNIGGFTCSKTVLFNAIKDTDSNFNIYAEDADKDKTPDYKLLEGHGDWHRGQNVNGAVPPFASAAPPAAAPGWGDNGMFEATYAGDAFLLWHRALIDAHLKWRGTFNIGGLIGPNPPPGTPPKPEYLKVDPDTKSIEESDVYNYVRLGEFQSLAELGADVVSPWHNQGHVDIMAATGFARMGGFDSPGAQEDTFWKWHSIVDEPRRDWKTDQAAVAGVDPAEKVTVHAAPTKITISFDKKVSHHESDLKNKIQITPGMLKVNGSAATSVRDVGTTSKFMVYEFSGFAAPAQGEVTVDLTGTASYGGKSYKFTYKKP